MYMSTEKRNRDLYEEKQTDKPGDTVDRKIHDKEL